MITPEQIDEKLVQGEDYYTTLLTYNRNAISIGQPTKNLQKINSLFHLTTALRYRVDKDIYDTISTTIYYKILRLLPINII